jgi:hypothetical protein
MLRTLRSSWPPGEARQRASKPAARAGLGDVLRGEHAAADRLVDALDLRHVQRAAASPTSTAPGMSSRGIDCQPPAAIVRAPYVRGARRPRAARGSTGGA